MDKTKCQSGENEELGMEDRAEGHEAGTKIQELKDELEAKTKKCEEYFNMLQRSAAEFDNYKKRTAKEKESIYNNAVADVVAAFLPVVDNVDRAMGASSGDDVDASSLKEGIGLICRQFKEVMGKLGVEEIKSLGEKFDPDIHNAVMHMEDPEYGESIVVEEFQKGYALKDRIIRYSMVKVVN
ncbi:MAG: nucleotide exchange factor GrpE [Clostridium sp.]|nr:nucleotide exchange factor GrpE [Clostridium sp.]